MHCLPRIFAGSHFAICRGGAGQKGQGLVIDAIKAVDDVVDFNEYARAGEVPNPLVVHAGAGAEFSGDPNLIWSHSSALSYWTGLTGYWADGVKINRCAMMPEIGGDPGGFMFGEPLGPLPPTVGTFAHEWGHVLGLPDEYDYGYESDGVGNYSIMAGGSWGFWYYLWSGLEPKFGLSGVTVDNIAETDDGTITADLFFAR